MDGEDSEKLAAARWGNVLDFVDWIAKRCGGEIENDGGLTVETEKKSVLEVAQTISVIVSLAERGDDQDVVDAVDAARRQGPRVAARAAGRRQRRPAAVQAARTTR